MTLRVVGHGAAELFSNESGGHRFQRVPPNEKRGRIHTSTITVAVLSEPEELDLAIPPGDLEWSTCRGSGPGGQNRNKVESAVQLKHKPTGLMVRCESERSQAQNRRSALGVLRARLAAKLAEDAANARADTRKQLVGTGMRGDKIRTIRYQDEQVNDHRTGRKWRLKDYLRGDW